MRKGISYKKISYQEHVSFWEKVVQYLDREYHYQRSVTFKK